jgi:AcrR family transcriptional regulator
MGVQAALSEARRRQILDAALRCFGADGFTATTVDEVVRRSGASVGSVYHHFGGKEELADALYVEGLRDYQAGLLTVLDRERDAERGVRAIVRHHLRWVEANPDLARFLLQRTAPVGERLADLNRETFARTAEWLRPHVRAGSIRRLPMDLYYAVLVGPAQEFARHWLHGRMKSTIGQAERALADAAWDAVAVRGG